MNPIRVVIIDDEQPARSRMRELLEDCRADFPHLLVGEAANGVDGLQVVSASAAGVVLVDIHMPEMSGIELLDMLNTEGIKVQFGFVTTERTPEMRLRAANAGAAFMIVKPFTPDDFKSVLSPILG